MKVIAMIYRTHKLYEESHWVSCLRENLTSSSDGEGLETGMMPPRQSFTRQIFFKTIKQHLKIKTFIGTSENALRIQIWTALIALLLLKYLHYLSKFGWSMSNLATMLRLNLFTYRDLRKWLDDPFGEPPSPPLIQLMLPGFGQPIGR